MFINRTWSRSEHDDYVLNVQPKLNQHNEAVPVSHNGQVLGWRIQNRFN